MAIKYETPDDRIKRLGQAVQKPAAKKKVERAGAKLKEALETLAEHDPQKPNTLFHSPKPKRQASPNSIRFPKEVLEFFRSDEPGWQRRINEALMKIAKGE